MGYFKKERKDWSLIIIFSAHMVVTGGTTNGTDGRGIVRIIDGATDGGIDGQLVEHSTE